MTRDAMNKIRESHGKSLIIGLVVTAVLWIFFSATYASVRTLFEDEITSFTFISDSYEHIWQRKNSAGFHPPGMHILSKAFYNLVGERERLISIGPLCLMFFSLTIFVYKSLYHFHEHIWAGLLFTAGCFLHPQLLLWSNSFRWYSYWTALALLTLTLGLNIAKKINNDGTLEVPGWPVFVGLGLLLTIMLHINYLTIPFMVFFLAALIFRFSLTRSLVKKITVTTLIFLTLSSAQLYVFMTLHLPNSSGQFRHSVFIGLSKLVVSVPLSQALVPWHPVAVLFLLVVIPILFIGLKANMASLIRNHSGILREPQTIFDAYVLFTILFCVMGGITGLGWKPRSFTLLSPIFIFMVACGFTHVKKMALKCLVTAVICLWIITGARNLLARDGLAVTTLNEHRDQVTDLVENQTKDADRCVLIFTYDVGLTYKLNKLAPLNGAWIVISPYDDFINQVFVEENVPLACKPKKVFLVESFAMPRTQAKKDQLKRLIDSIRMNIDGSKVKNLSRDSDVRMKKMIPGLKFKSQHLPEYRFMISYGTPLSAVDWTSLAESFVSFPFLE